MSALVPQLLLLPLHSCWIFLNSKDSHKVENESALHCSTFSQDVPDDVIFYTWGWCFEFAVFYEANVQKVVGGAEYIL